MRNHSESCCKKVKGDSEALVPSYGPQASPTQAAPYSKARARTGVYNMVVHTV